MRPFQALFTIGKTQDRAPDDTVAVKFNIDLSDSGGGFGNIWDRLDNVIIAPVTAGGHKVHRDVNRRALLHCGGECGIVSLDTRFTQQDVEQDRVWLCRLKLG